ncbi:Hypothetical protein R9X50_00727000 [Acrodontium crateriforme]|uniref:Cutinase n=1 Tax=Acrodontium crateriforme TaxID=150365 RepID=A0AAQ3RAL7_9PEZI|nr:Hypothetical protein R9X50_00727000 [Acrodontium crateriforme]
MKLSFVIATALSLQYQTLAAPIKRNLEVNAFLAKIADYFHVDVAIEDVCNIITDGESLLAAAFSIDATQNLSGCSDVTLLFARGTCDDGNIGALVGAPFVDALRTALNGRSLGVQGIDYPASVDGYLTNEPQGGQLMATTIRNTIDQCPNTQIILGGYSQGGMVVHNAATDAGSDLMSSISSVVIFGDPFSHQAVDNIDSSRVLIECHAGDDICNDGDLILLQHLTYADKAAEAASFVVSKLS